MTELDPAWEYWEGSPEVDEIIYGSTKKSSTFDDIGMTYNETTSKTEGFRFGRGNPNSGFFTYGNKHKPLFKESKPRVAVHCKKCKNLFFSEKRNPKYCSRECSCFDYKCRERIAKTCEACQTEFTSIFAQQKYCSASCVPKTKRKEVTPPKFFSLGRCRECKKRFYKAKQKKDVYTRAYCSEFCREQGKKKMRQRSLIQMSFQTLFKQGLSFREISERLQVHRSALRAWARKMNLPKRAFKKIPIPMTPLQREELQALCQQGKRQQWLLDYFQVGKDILNRWKRELGIPIPKRQRKVQ